VLGVAFTLMAFLLVGLALVPTSGDKAFGQKSGCCKARGCETCAWYVIPKTYDACDRLNEERDGDRLESERGTIQWSNPC
jgi:hypothetical protein